MRRNIRNIITPIYYVLWFLFRSFYSGADDKIHKCQILIQDNIKIMLYPYISLFVTGQCWIIEPNCIVIFKAPFYLCITTVEFQCRVYKHLLNIPFFATLKNEEQMSLLRLPSDFSCSWKSAMFLNLVNDNILSQIGIP